MKSLVSLCSSYRSNLDFFVENVVQRFKILYPELDSVGLLQRYQAMGEDLNHCVTIVRSRWFAIIELNSVAVNSTSSPWHS